MVHLGNLATEQRNPRTERIDQTSTVDLLTVINDEDAKIAAAVQRSIVQIAPFLDQLVDRVRAGGNLFYIGAGTSGRLGVLDASECPPTFGVSPNLVQGIIAGGESALSRATEASEDDPEMGARDLFARGFTAKDAVMGIAASGRTPYVLGAIQSARTAGALTAALVCAEDSALEKEAEYPIVVPVGPEVLTGSTRMKAGTATKLVLNMVSTGLMIRLGHTFGNLMVNVQPKNEKLVDRARRIVADSTGITPEAASALFELAGRDVKTAIVMEKLKVSKTQAAELLARKQGVLAEILHG